MRDEFLEKLENFSDGLRKYLKFLTVQLGALCFSFRILNVDVVVS